LKSQEQRPGAKAKATAIAIEDSSLFLQVLLFNQKPLNKMPGAATVIALPWTRTPGG
jgi:hypothetical protein